MVSLFELQNVTIILAFSSSLGLHKSFIGLLFNHIPHIIIRDIAIWGVRQLIVRGDTVTEIFSTNTEFSCLCSMAQCPVTIYRVSSCHFLNPGSKTSFGPLMQASLEENKWRHSVTIASDHPKHHDIDWVFGFHQFESIPKLTPQTLWNLCIGAVSMNTKLYSMPFPNFWSNEFRQCCFPHRQCQTDCSFYTGNKTQNK